MIVAKGVHEDGKTLYLLGLTRENIDALLAGQPLMRDLSFTGTPFHVVVVYGEDAIEIEYQLRQAGIVDASTKREMLPEPPEED